MGKKVKEYKSGDFIFAKVKGYPAWPARVQRPNGKKYFVYFYGTGETANLPPNQIFDYAENKDKFLTKTVKRKDFNDGVRQIEHDFANNVPIEEIVGVIEEPMDTSAVANSTVNDTVDDSALDTTAANDTVNDEANTSQNDAPVDDSDEGGLVIDEGKKGKKVASKSVSAATPRTPRTPKAKKEETKESKEDDDTSKKEEEIVSRSGRKIRPKRYIDEQTEENSTLPSPIPKKRGRAASPQPEKEKKAPEVTAPVTEKSNVHYNALTQSELEDLKEPPITDQDKDSLLIVHLPSGQYVGIKLFQSKPNSFKNDAVKLQWYKQAAANAVTLKSQLEKGHITSQSVSAQLETELNLTEEEKTNLDKEREIEEKKSRVQFLKTEMKLIELDSKIKSCLSLEKADTELCLKLIDEFMELELKPLMLLKHPACLETVKRMRAYVGNTPCWELSEAEASAFCKQAQKIRKRADKAYSKIKELFTTPDGLSFFEYYTEKVAQFKKCSEKLSADELLEMVHEPLELSNPSALTMRSAIDALNEETASEKADKTEETTPKKKAAAAKNKKGANNTPTKTPVKRQNSRNKVQPEAEANKNDSEPATNTEETAEKPAETDADKVKDIANDNAKDSSKDNDKEATTNKNDSEKEISNQNDTETEKDTINTNNDVTTAEPPKESTELTNNDKAQTEEETSKETAEEANKTAESEAENSDKAKEIPEEKQNGDGEAKNDKNDSSEETKAEEKADGEPRAKRSRENKQKTEPPPPKSPTKRKTRS